MISFAVESRYSKRMEELIRECPIINLRVKEADPFIAIRDKKGNWIKAEDGENLYTIKFLKGNQKEVHELELLEFKNEKLLGNIIEDYSTTVRYKFDILGTTVRKEFLCNDIEALKKIDCEWEVLNDDQWEMLI